MHYRPLGRTGMSVSEIGYGAWGIGGGWGAREDDEALAALHRAIDAGVTFIDTAYGYGNGHSERLIGSVIAERTDEVHVATKIPPLNRRWPAAHDTPAVDAFPARHVREITEESLRRLGVDTIDVQQFHVWAPRWLHEGDWRDEVQRLKDEHKIRAFGVSINDHEPETAVELAASGVVDTLQVIYNIFDQSPEDELLPACQEHGVGVVVRVPLDEGGLTGRITPETTFEDTDWRRSYFRGDRPRQVFEHANAIVADLGIELDQLPEVALRFVLSHPAVSTVIPGMRRAQNVDRNVAVADGRPLPAEQIDLLHKHRWVRNFYG